MGMRTRSDQKIPKHGSNLPLIQGVIISLSRIEVLEMEIAVPCRCAPGCLGFDIPDGKPKKTK